MAIQESELILNPDGSVYHLNLKPEHISDNIIFVGDQDRVEKITKHFDSVEVSIQKREFKTQTGTYKGKRLTVISTGIGPDNIDIVLSNNDNKSSSKEILILVKKSFNKFSYNTKINHPFKGGFITTKYGNPEKKIHFINVSIFINFIKNIHNFIIICIFLLNIKWIFFYNIRLFTTN